MNAGIEFPAASKLENFLSTVIKGWGYLLLLAHGQPDDSKEEVSGSLQSCSWKQEVERSLVLSFFLASLRWSLVELLGQQTGIRSLMTKREKSTGPVNSKAHNIFDSRDRLPGLQRPSLD